MRINDTVVVHFANGATKYGAVKALVGAGTSGYKALVIGTDQGDVGTKDAGVPHYHDRGSSSVYWTQTHEHFAPAPVPAAPAPADINDE
jgi:hypothetical protein